MCEAFDSSSQSYEDDDSAEGGKAAAVHVISLLEDYKKSNDLYEALLNLVGNKN